MKILVIRVLVCVMPGALFGQPAAPTVAPLAGYGGSLQAPARVAADKLGNFYVTDPNAGQVVTFDSFGSQKAVWRGLGRPLGIALDDHGKIFISDCQAGSVTVLDADWTLLFKLGAGEGEFLLPNHLALTPAGDAIYVSDSAANVIKVYRGATLVNQFGGSGTGPAQFDFPAGLCVGPAGQVFVVDQNNDRIQVFAPSGSFIRSFNLGASTPLGRSQGVLLDDRLRLYVTDAFQGTVRVFDSNSGTFLATIGAFGESAGQLSSPGGLALDPFNRLCVASANNARLELYGLDAFLHVSASQPVGFVPAGTNLLLTVSAGGDGPFGFRWLRNGQQLPGETNASLIMANLTREDSASYSVVVTSASGSVTSSVACFTVMAPPAILAGPESRIVLSGTDLLHSVQARGTDLLYQWFYNGLEIASATDASLRLLDVQPHQAGEYSVRVSNPAGTAVSPTALLTVLSRPSQMEIVSAVTQPDQFFRLTLNVDPGHNYTLEASTDFIEWEPLARLVNDAGLVDFVDLQSTNFWNRFYRVHWEP